MDFVRLFERLDLRYVIMGGLAVRVHGIPRPTHDVDFTVAIDRSELAVLFDAVTDLGYSVPPPYERGWVDEVGGMPLIKFRTYLDAEHGIDVDIFLAESAFQQSVLSRRQTIQIDGVTAWLVSPEDLILLKLLAGRARDKADIGDILFMQGELDRTYLRRWAKQLGIATELEETLKRPGD